MTVRRLMLATVAVAMLCVPFRFARYIAEDWTTASGISGSVKAIVWTHFEVVLIRSGGLWTISTRLHNGKW